MKRFVLIAALVGLLALALASTALAAPSMPGAAAPCAAGGCGIHTPGTGLSQPNAGYGPRGGMGAGAGLRQGAPTWAGQSDAVEALLDMSEADIQAARLKGQSLAQIAATKKVTEKQLVDGILTAKKAILDAQVAEGKLTQAQADAVYSHMQTQVSVMVNRTTTGPAGAQGQGIGRQRGGRVGGRWANQ